MSTPTHHLIELSERVARMEAKQDLLIDLMEKHAENDQSLKEEMDEIRTDVARGLAAVSILKWLVGVTLAALGTLASLIKLLK